MKVSNFWGQPFTDQAIEAARASGGLLTMELELSRVCNLRCVYCYAESGLPLEDELSFDEVMDAVDQARVLGARRIIVLGGGEPMAYPRIMDVLRGIAERALEIELFTNGTLLSPEIAMELYGLGVHPIIKFNSMNQQVQDALADCAGTFEAIQLGLQNLRSAGYPNGLSLGAQTIICRQNLTELPTMWRHLRGEGIIPYFETITAQGRATSHTELFVEPQELRALFEELASIDEREYGLSWVAKPPVAAFTCKRHLFSCTITAVGDVIPCPGVNLPTGNIRVSPLREILSASPVFQDLRDIRRRIKGRCASCELSSECYGCRGMAYQACGDYLASDPLCWRPSGEEDGCEPARNC